MAAIRAMQSSTAEMVTAAMVPGVQVSFMGMVEFVRLSRHIWR